MGGSVLLLVTRCKLESSVVWMKSQRHERTLPVNILSNIVVPFLHTVCLSVRLSQQHRGAVPPRRLSVCLSQQHRGAVPPHRLSVCLSVCLSNIVAPFLHTGRFSVSFEPPTHESFLYRTSLRLRGTLP